jgi:3-oxoacyl-[acyl-carrier-protein] synthase-3
MTGVRLAGTGHYLPGRPLDHETLRASWRRFPDGLPERMEDRLLRETGIGTRHLGMDVATGALTETNTSMATEAGKRALAAAGWRPEDVELLVVTTVVPDQLMPSTSTLVQEALGIRGCAELEIVGNCTAPYKALWTASNSLRLGAHRRALVCNVQFVSFLGVPPWSNLSRVKPHQAHLRRILSDGAGAVALEGGEPDSGLRVWLESPGDGRPPGMELRLGAAQPDVSGAFERGDHHVVQRTREIRQRAMADAVDGMMRMLREFEIPPSAIDHFIPEVPSMGFARILKQLGVERLGLPEHAWRVALPRIGNVGGVAFPIVLDQLARAGTLRRGDLVCSFAEESSKWMFAGTVFRWNP